MTEISISPENKKMGKTPSVSFQRTTCASGLPCYGMCYAGKGTFKYDNVQMAYLKNLEAYKENADNFFNQVINYLNDEDITYNYFRWFVSGDIVDYKFFLGIIRTAKECPRTKFFMPTKKYDIVNMYMALGHKIPKNLVVMFSGWDDAWEFDNSYNFPTSYLKENNKPNKHITESTRPCSDDCHACRHYCWGLKNGQSVYWEKH